MKALAALLILSFSASSFASSRTETLIELCRPVGIEKLHKRAEVLHLVLDEDSVRECGVDNRRMNPSKYVWFCGESTDGSKSLRVMTQKPVFKDCF